MYGSIVSFHSSESMTKLELCYRWEEFVPLDAPDVDDKSVVGELDVFAAKVVACTRFLC